MWWIFWRAGSPASAPASRLSSAIPSCSVTYAHGLGGAGPGRRPPSGARVATLHDWEARAAGKSVRAAYGSSCSSSGATSSSTRLSLVHVTVGSLRDTRSLPWC